MPEDSQVAGKHHYVFLCCAILGVLLSALALPFTAYCAYVSYSNFHANDHPPAGTATPMLKASVYDYSLAFVLACCAALCLMVLVFGIRWLIQRRKKPASSVSNKPSRLKIISAYYGGDGGENDTEVAEKYLQPRILGDALAGWVGADLFGAFQPVINQRKRLKVHYSFEGKEATIIRHENELLVLPEDPQLKAPPTALPALDGEIHRIVRGQKDPNLKITRQLWEGVKPGKEFQTDTDILVEMYVVNTSSETQYIRDFCGSVEIDGLRVTLARENNFDAFDVGDGMFEYCFDTTPNERVIVMDGKSEALKPLFSELPTSLEPRAAIEGWVHFELKAKDPDKLIENRTYDFVLIDSLGKEYQISRAANPQRTMPPLKCRRKRG